MAVETPVPELVQTAKLPAPAPPRLWTWTEVEQELDRLRAERKTRPSATADIIQWYRDLGKPKFTHSKNYSDHLSLLEKWRRDRPESPLPLVVLAEAHVGWAWEIRGTGLASTVSEEAWPIFHARIGEARQLVEKAIKLGVEDGHAYAVLLTIAKADGHSLEQTRLWLEEGRKADPTYTLLYVSMGDYLLPKWHGEPGDVERYAAEVAQQLPGDDGLDAYAHIAWMVHFSDCHEGNTLFFGEFDPKLLSQAAEVWGKRYPMVPWKVHFAALCTLAAQDHAAARRIRPLVEEYYEHQAIWPWRQSHAEFLAWCEANEVPRDEETRVWTSHFVGSGLTFDDDSQYIWCGHEFRGPATLLDLKSKRARLELKSIDCNSNNLVIDRKRNWILASAWRPFRGLILWDLSQPSLGQRIQVPGLCEALAIHPEEDLVAWGDRISLKLLELPGGKPIFEVSSAEPITSLCFSPTGKMLAAGPEPWKIYDTQSRQVLCELPRGDASPTPCQQILALDDDGSCWAIVEKVVPHTAGGNGAIGSKVRSLVRLAADASIAETLLEEIPRGTCWLSADRQLLAVAKRTKYGQHSQGIEVWDVPARTRTHDLSGHWCQVEDIAFSRDNKRLASTGMSTGMLKVWRLDQPSDKSE